MANRIKKYLTAASAASLVMLLIPIAFADELSDLGVNITPGTLSIYCTPPDFTMDTINIESPITTYHSYYINPHTIAMDGCTPLLNAGTSLVVQDGRYAGGFELQAQVTDDYLSGSDTIAHENLGVITDNSTMSENTTPGLTATAFPLDAGSTSNPADYADFTAPVVLINGNTCSATDEGRIGYYVIFPSFHLTVPNTTPAGTYTTTVTYDLLDSSTC